MASTYVKVTSLEDALKYFDAELMYWHSLAHNEWLPQSKVASGRFPPAAYEVHAGYWAILVEE